MDETPPGVISEQLDFQRQSEIKVKRRDKYIFATSFKMANAFLFLFFLS